MRDLHAAITDGDDQTTPRGQLFQERRWHTRRCTGNNDTVIGGCLGPTLRPVFVMDADSLAAQIFEARCRDTGKLCDALQAVYLFGEMFQKRGLVT